MCTLSRVYIRMDNFVVLTAAFGFHLFPSTKLTLCNFLDFQRWFFPSIWLGLGSGLGLKPFFSSPLTHTHVVKDFLHRAFFNNVVILGVHTSAYLLKC